MGAYTVQSAEHKKDWQGEYGLMRIYEVRFESGETAEIMQKADTPIPSSGQVLNGTLEPSKFGLRFKKDKPAQFGGGGSSNSTGGGGQRSGMSDADWKARDAVILRQHSQAMALEYVSATGVAPVDYHLETADGRAFFRRIIDWFDADAKQAAQKAKDSAEVVYGKPPVRNEGAVPTGKPELSDEAPSHPQPPAKFADVDSVPFHHDEFVTFEEAKSHVSRW